MDLSLCRSSYLWLCKYIHFSLSWKTTNLLPKELLQKLAPELRPSRPIFSVMVHQLPSSSTPSLLNYSLFLHASLTTVPCFPFLMPFAPGLGSCSGGWVLLSDPATKPLSFCAPVREAGTHTGKCRVLKELETEWVVMIILLPSRWDTNGW